MKSINYLLLLAILFSSVSCKEYFRKKALKGVDTLMSQPVPEIYEEDTVEFVEIVEEVEPEPVVVREVVMGYSTERYYMIVGSFLSEKLAVKYANTVLDMGYEPNVIYSSMEGYYRVSAQSYGDRTTAVNDIQNFRNNVTGTAWVHVKN